MDSEIQARINADATKALAAYDALTAKQVRLNRAVEMGNRAAKDYQKTISKNFRDAGQSVGRAGGPLGTAGSQILGSAGMDSTFGRLGVAVGLVAFGFRALTSVVDSRIAKEREVIEQTRKLGDALENAGKQAGKQGLAAVPLAQQVRTLEGLGGNFQQASDLAEQIAIPIEDAVKGLTTIRANARTQEEMRGAIREASILATTGRASFTEGAQGVFAKGSTRAMLGQDAGQASAAYLRSRGEQASAAQLTVTAPEFLRSSNVVPQLERIQRTQNQTEEAGFLELIGGSAAAAAMEDFAKNAQPAAVAMQEWNKKAQEGIAAMDQLAKEEWKIVAILRNSWIARLAGGEGSLSSQAARQREILGDTLFGANSPLRQDGE